MKNKAVIRFSMYQPDEGGHGGYKRVAQLFELFEKAQVHVIDFGKEATHAGLLKKARYFSQALKIIIKHNRFYGILSAIKEAQLIGRDLNYLEKILNKSRNTYEINYFIWEYTWSQYWYIPIIAKQSCLKVIAIPHNLESLVYSQKSHKQKNVLSPLWLDEEIEYLDYCNKIFCISREEQWLLSLKVNPNKVHYLPYYPSKAAIEFLLDIRKERQKIKQSQTITILGSAVNPPTLKGMLDLKNHFLSNNNLEFMYDFVGYGVEWIKKDDENLPDNFRVSESVTNDLLREKLVKTSCIIINQIPSSGALTKIQEMLFAGIPILVNSMGARSYYNIDGIFVYESWTHLDALLNDLDDLIVPEIPKIDAVYESSLLSLFKNI